MNVFLKPQWFILRSAKTECNNEFFTYKIRFHRRKSFYSRSVCLRNIFRICTVITSIPTHSQRFASIILGYIYRSIKSFGNVHTNNCIISRSSICKTGEIFVLNNRSETWVLNFQKKTGLFPYRSDLIAGNAHKKLIWIYPFYIYMHSTAQLHIQGVSE